MSISQIVQVMGYLLFKLKYHIDTCSNSDTKTDIVVEQQVVAPMESVSISELENVTCTDDGADNDDEHVTHDQALGILEQEPVQKQQI